jgi:hypothetical protein
MWITLCTSSKAGSYPHAVQPQLLAMRRRRQFAPALLLTRRTATNSEAIHNLHFKSITYAGTAAPG